jgi:hypothetical protein
MQLVPFTPQTESYFIYYPQTHVLEEQEDGVVTIASIENDINFIIKEHTQEQKATLNVLRKFYEEAVSSYKMLTEMEMLESKHPILIEAEFVKDETYWLWWGIANENQILLAAVNSEHPLDDENYNLYRHLIETIEINPYNFKE